MIFAIYDQPLMLQKQIEVWSDYDQDVRERLRLIIVDDAGPKHPVILRDDLNFDCQVFRIRENIPWNQMGARNLAMKHAGPGWCLMIDPDMVVPKDVMRRIVDRVPQCKRRERYLLPLRHMRNGKVDEKGSPNVYLIHQEDFWWIGAYDEDYRGNKGYSDVMLSHTMNTVGMRKPMWKDCPLDFYGCDHIPDAQVHEFSRDYAKNRLLHVRKVAEARKKGWHNWIFRGRTTLRFDWWRVR